MMFDPPDFPYRELSETLREHYSAEDLFNNDISNTEASSTGGTLIEPNQNATNTDSQLELHSNNSGRYFNIESASYGDVNAGNSQPNTELYVVQPDMFNFVPTLLDDSIVNQFLLPLHVSEKDKDVENGPDLLALHSCAVCHEIFTTEADLLDHTISFHASDNTDRSHSNVSINIDGDSINETINQNFEADWFVCGVCERILSAASEGESNDQNNSKNLCCIDENGKVSITTRKLSAMYVCDYCSYLFADGEALDRHRSTCCSDKGQYDPQPMEPLGTDISSTVITELLDSCNISKDNSTTDSFSTNVVYQRKVQTRQTRRPCSSTGNSKMWNCGSCNQLFATARELYRHKRGEDRPAGAPLMAYVCEECDKVLGSMCALHTHKKMHKVTKPGYPCRVCGRRFNQSGHLAIHMRMHTGERPYPCDLCPKAFKVKVERDDHRRTHTGERPFACTACPKTFTAAARLREHARIHTDQRPYRCEICGAAFRRPYARTVHTLIHSGAKPHKCDVCGTAFRRSGDMWKHKRTLHGIPTSNAL